NERGKEAYYRAAGVLEALPSRVLVDPVEQAAVVREIKFAEALGGAEGRSLRAEIGAANEDGIHHVAHRGVNARQVADGDVALPVEDPVDVIPAAAGGHVPLGHIADSLGMFQEWAGN